MASTDTTVETPPSVLAEPINTWDGKDFPYKPDDDLPISDKLTLHTAKPDTELDPITFEVLSTKLWNINEEHADTIQRVSGSPVVVDNYDFNTSITTESGVPFLFAPYIQYFAGAAEYIVKYTLENRSDSPGINPGDIFVSNDCLIAGSHQMDVGIYAPVFIDGELFCWVFNACHARDTGGTEPGSFCIQAENIFWDPPMMRAVKLADENGIRSDAEDTFLRFSRIPHMLALEIRSQIAGVTRARARVEGLFETYSPDTVKATMNKLIDDTEAAVAERLREVPDGKWTDVVYCGGAFPGDRDVHKTVVTMEKKGDKLFFDNHGTDPQVAAFNCGFGQWRSAIGCALTHMLAYDHKLCVGGAIRTAEFDAEIGTISSVNREGAFSSLHPQLLTIFQAEKVIGKMLFPDPDQREHLIATSMLSTCGWVTHSGTDQWGNQFASVTLDHSAGGLGAFATRDGIDQGGTTFWPKSEAPDCEAWEQFFPVLYLYRRAALNAGHGKFRGGNGIAFALIGHGTTDQVYSTISVASGTPTQTGVFGGHHGGTGLYYGVGDSNVQELFARGEIPSGPDDVRALSGDGRVLGAKTNGLPLGPGDVIEQIVFGGGGYGDPLERDPEAVLNDIETGQVSTEIAEKIYGVIVKGSDLDAEATADLRDSIRSKRLSDATMPEKMPDLSGPFDLIIDIAEALAVADVDGTPMIVCTRGDGAVICSLDENYKDHVARHDTALTEINPDVFTDPAKDTDADVVYRQYFCPVTGTLLDNELTIREAPPVWDMRIDASSLPR
jgi:N-methylhydantoinase B